MSRGDRQDEHYEDSPDAETPDADVSIVGASAAIEARLEALAQEMSRLIGSGPADDRESLHDYAVSLVRDALPVAEDNERLREPLASVGRTRGRESASKVGVGYGLLILPAGFLLLPVLPPVGVLLVVAGAGMIAVGMVAAVLVRVKPSRSTPEP